MALVKYNNNSIADVTAFDSIPTGALVLLTTNTISSGVSSSSFTSSIDSTYDTYIFKIINVHPASAQYFQFQASTDGGSNYNTTITSTAFDAYHFESGSATGLRYGSSGDLAESTSFKSLYRVTPNTDNDASASGLLHLFDPSNTTFVKHFIARSNTYYEGDSSIDSYTGGYCNVTAAIDGVDFKFSSGNIDSGVIKMYGVL